MQRLSSGGAAASGARAGGCRARGRDDPRHAASARGQGFVAGASRRAHRCWRASQRAARGRTRALLEAMRSTRPPDPDRTAQIGSGGDGVDLSRPCRRRAGVRHRRAGRQPPPFAAVQAPTAPAPRPVAPPPKAPDVPTPTRRRRRRGDRRRARAGQACLAARTARQGPRRLRGCVHGCARAVGDHRRDVDGARGGAAARRCRARGHRGAARRSPGAGQVEGDHRTGAAARRAQADMVAASGRRRPRPALRRLAADPAARTSGCSSASTASARRPRSARSRTADRRRPVGAARRGRHVPRRRRRAARHVGRAGRRRVRPRRRGR